MGPVVQVLTPGGGRVTCSVAVATPVRTGLQGFVLQIRRSDGAHALESALVAMGQDRPLGDVMAHVAAMLEGELPAADRSEEHTSELQSLMRISYAVFCLKKKK